MCFEDGNCLFRAVSTILFGSEDHHTELRMRSILELANKEKKYLAYSYLQFLTGAHAVVKNLLPSSLHFISRNPSSCYRNEALRTIQSSTFANMWHIFALANVLGFPVKLVHPAVQNAGTDRALRNINMTPSASAKSTCNQCIRLIWSHSSNTTKKGWGPNYFVPLLPADVTRSTSGEWFTAKSRGTKRKVGTPGNSASPTKQKQPLTINLNHQLPSLRHQPPVLRYQPHLRHQPPDLNQPHLPHQPPHLRHQPRLLHHVRLRQELSFNPHFI